MTSKSSDMARQVIQGFILKGGPIVETMFNGYRLAVMPPGAGAVQVLECKRAFFAGCRVLLDLMMAAADPEDDVTERDMEIMAAIEAELTAWMQDGQMAEHTATAPIQGNA